MKLSFVFKMGFNMLKLKDRMDNISHAIFTINEMAGYMDTFVLYLQQKQIT